MSNGGSTSEIDAASVGVSLCASCGGATSTVLASCEACGKDWRLDGRYRLVRRLGHGAWGTTFEAVRIADGERLAIKELLVRRLEDFKTHDLFKREASILEMLEHRGIPRYVDDFAAGEGRHLGLYLVTELIDGVTLEQEMKGRRHSQQEVVAIARELCEILSYLHGLAPPVVHRDIKPSNVMRRRADQSLVLIDFGAVKESLRAADDGGSTVAGTFGFMPPEQLAGRASPASDLYALGVLIVALTTREPVANLLDDANRLRWEDHLPRGTPLSDGLRDILTDVLERDPNKRLADAGELARRLDELLAGRYRVESRGAVASPNALELVARLLPGRLGDMLSQLGEAVAPGVADPPPPAPRKVSFGFGGRTDPIGSFFRLFGVLFGGIPTIVLFSIIREAGPPSLFLLLFTLVGGTLATVGFTRIARAKRLFQHGEAVEATVTESWLDTRLRVNGRSPHRVTFRYRTPDGAEREGSVSRFKIRPDLRVPGARVYALYDPKKPSRVTMWPID